MYFCNRLWLPNTLWLISANEEIFTKRLAAAILPDPLEELWGGRRQELLRGWVIGDGTEGKKGGRRGGGCPFQYWNWMEATPSTCTCPRQYIIHQFTQLVAPSGEYEIRIQIIMVHFLADDYKSPWPLTWETFSTVSTHIMNICAKFNWNPPTIHIQRCRITRCIVKPCILQYGRCDWNRPRGRP